MTARAAEQFVYALSRQHPLPGYAYKIGRSRWPRQRRAGLQVATPDRLTLVASIMVADAPATERMLHEALAPLRISGEWFHCMPNLIKQLFDTIERIGSLDYFCTVCVEHAVACRN